MVWKPAKVLGIAAGLTIAAALFGIAIFLVGRISELNLGWGWYTMVLIFGLCLLLLALWGYWYYSLLTLHYYLDRDSLVIASGGVRHRVPMDAIQRIIPGSDATASRSFHGVGWPGYLMGRMRLRRWGTLVVRSTEPLAHQLVVVTDSLCYGISPREPKRFMEDYALRRALGPIHQVDQTVEHARLLALPVWRDRWYWGVTLLAFFASIALLGLVAGVYGGLPDRVAIHLGSREVARVVSKSSLLALPAMGALALVVNSLLGLLLHRRERLGAYLLAGMAFSVQAILWLAATGILRG